MTRIPRKRSCFSVLLRGLLALLVPAVSGIAQGGDREGVIDVLGTLRNSWPEALFSIEVSGVNDTEAVLNHRVDIAYEAKVPGYMAYVVVSSHGDMTLYRSAGNAARGAGVESYLVKPPLGKGQVIALFSDTPWNSFFPHGGVTQELGSDRDSATAFLARLGDPQGAQLRVANRRFELVTEAAAGATEYTTRGIVMKVQQQRGDGSAPGAVARIPSRIEFEFDSDRLTPQGKLDLDTFGEALVTELRDNNVSLEGHTDSIGSDDYNLALSERRAQAARQYLHDSFGLPDSRLAAVGMGKSDPVASNDDESGRSHNRRVDFVFSHASPRSDTPGR